MGHYQQNVLRWALGIEDDELFRYYIVARLRIHAYQDLSNWVDWGHDGDCTRVDDLDPAELRQFVEFVLFAECAP